MVLKELATIGSAVLGGVASSSAAKRAEREEAKRREELRKGYKRGSKQMKRGAKIMRQRVKEGDKAHAEAKAATTLFGESARRQVQQQSAEAKGSILQSMSARGLYNTTVLDSVMGGLSAQTARALADIEEKVGMLHSQQALAKMGTKLDTLGDLAGYKTQQAGFQANMGQAMFSAYNPKPGSGYYDFSGIGSAVGGLLKDVDWGSLFGSPQAPVGQFATNHDFAAGSNTIAASLGTLQPPGPWAPPASGGLLL